ncbi:efflux RND transporter periplasmic adaptor subunit [Gallaecimonas kandeliae]|uniref:efflux RND transporter periplasmic adaptor subunit n=1 Tax=Gallaecimonas kandeliae TaxID=3029055 RepID=UPI0026479751|nr:efflux RND transporter periplasmic adaptor subunit [Gallaecimonas kandeliae]WKE64017.1 efflux RND transporter periplasmic adaptor subunit [Gallaecimonas kandeliae]
MRRLLIGLAILGLGALLVWAKVGQGQAGVKVDLVKAEKGTLKHSVLASGKLAYREQVQLRSEVSGIVKQVLVEEGDHVKKGQLLLALDPQSYQAQVDAQTAYVNQSRIAIERQQSYLETLGRQVDRKVALHAKGLLDTDAFETAKSELTLAKIDLQNKEQALNQAQAELDRVKELLAKTRFIAPMDGVVTAVDVKVGETVIPGTTNIVGSSLMTLADTSAILTEVEVDEADIAGVKLGQDADIYAVAFPDTALAGKVESIATTARQAVGRQGMSFKVKILLDDLKGKAIRPGMSCRAEIFTQTAKDVLLVPLEAVRYDADDKPFAMSVKDGIAHRVALGLGLSDDTQQVVTQGLAEGEQLVRGPARALKGLKDGDKVAANG